MTDAILFRRGTSQLASANNPILKDGEPGWAKDTRIFKIGDGVTPWNDLPTQGGDDITREELSATFVRPDAPEVINGEWRFTSMPKVQSSGGSPIMAKPLGSGLLSPIEIVHDDTEGYLWHPTAGPNMGGNAAYLGFGIRYGGTGILIRNYGDTGPAVEGSTGRITIGLAVNNLSSLTTAGSAGLSGTQASSAAILVRLRAATNTPAPLLSLSSQSGTFPVAGSRLQEWFNSAGVRTGEVAADTGRLTWRARVTVTEGSAAFPSTMEQQVTTGGDSALTWRVTTTGTTDSYWNMKTVAAGDRWKLMVSKGPAATGAETWATMIEARANSGAGGFGQMGFFGVTPANRPAAIASPAEDVVAIKTAVDAIRTALLTLGLTQ